MIATKLAREFLKDHELNLKSKLGKLSKYINKENNHLTENSPFEI